MTRVLAEFQRGERIREALLRLFGAACVVVVSFLITLALLDTFNSRQDALIAEIREAVAKAGPTAGGLRVFSPADAAQTGYGAPAAFDGSTAPASFWEPHDFPIDLIVLLPAAQRVTQYRLSSGEVANRMPKSWTLQGSSDGLLWLDLDRQANAPSWKSDETRTYPVHSDAQLQVLRFRFTEGYYPNLMRIYEIGLG